MVVAGGAVGGGWANWGMGMKEGTRWDEHWVPHGSDESPGSTPEDEATYCLLTNWNENK